MAIFDLYSKRQKRLRGEVPDIYAYDSIPHELRVQIVHIIRDAIGESRNYSGKSEEVYSTIHKALCREYGIFSLAQGRHGSDESSVINFFLTTKDIDKAIDVIELTFQLLDRVIKPDFGNYNYHVNVKTNPDDAIDELNERLKEHGVGYQFEASEIIRVDSTYTHAEIVKPTLNLLQIRTFAGANDEYLSAHEHYRHGRNKECLTDCLKAFESALKIICKEKGWPFNPTDTSKKLIQVCFQNGLVPPYTQNQFTSLQNLLESGIPTIRNKLGGHGQGAIPQSVDDGMTRYALNLTGTNIIFIVEQSGVK